MEPRGPHSLCVCGCERWLWHTPLTHGMCVHRHARTTAHMCTNVPGHVCACMCNTIACITSTQHACTDVLQHIYIHRHPACLCMHVHACASAKYVSWPRGHAHVCILQHLCVHTCGHTPATCMCTCNSTRCVHLREERVCLWVKLFLLHFSLMSLLLPIAPKMQHL